MRNLQIKNLQKMQAGISFWKVPRNWIMDGSKKDFRLEQMSFMPFSCRKKPWVSAHDLPYLSLRLVLDLWFIEVQHFPSDLKLQGGDWVSMWNCQLSNIDQVSTIPYFTFISDYSYIYRSNSSHNTISFSWNSLRNNFDASVYSWFF